MSTVEPRATAPFAYVETPAELARLARTLDAEPWHALDTESNSGFVYDERLCLLQFNAGGRLWLVDLVALERSEPLATLRPALESPDRTTYLHGGEFDVGCLKRDYGVELRGVWDSQQAASFLGLEKTGYAAVVEQICGVELDKAYTQYDWGRRPLESKVLAYAVDDVRYLPEVCRALRERVAAADLDEELAIANRAVEAATWDGGYRPEGFWKIKGAGALAASRLPLLAALWQWRDEVARIENRPAGRILNNRLLVALSARPPRNRDALRRAGVRGRLVGRSGELLSLLERVRRDPPAVPPRPRPANAENGGDGRENRAREIRLKKWRTGEAARRGVPLQAVLPSRALDHLKRNGAGNLESVPQLGSKRIRMYGDRLRELLE